MSDRPIAPGLIPPKTFAESLRRCRSAHGLSQAALARLIGVERQTISWWEQGRGEPSGANFERLRAEFGEALMDLTPPPDDASMAYWLGRVEQIASHMRAVLAEQEELVQHMRGTPPAGDVAKVIALAASVAASHRPSARGRRRAPETKA